MNFVKAIKAFCRVFFAEGECGHSRVNLLQAPSYCPDCGYYVKIEWLFVHCRACNAKRVPHQGFCGDIRPLHQYCRHCGKDGFKIVKKGRIEAYELMYAVSMKTTDFSETPSVAEPPVTNPFRTTATVENSDIFEAEVLKKTEFKGTKSAFKTPPFTWQTKQDPKRYGGTYNPVESNLLPMRKLS